jgi:hypothetical protein
VDTIDRMMTHDQMRGPFKKQIPGDRRLHEENRNAEMISHSEKEIEAPVSVSCEAGI